MEMQDREFDQLFNSKLNDIEAEPSAQVWQNITTGLDGKKAARSLLPHLSIAASIVVLASVSIWFFNHANKKEDQPRAKFVKHVKPVTPLYSAGDDSTTVLVERENDTYLKQAAVTATKKAVHANTVLQPEQVKPEAPDPSTQTVVQNAEPVLAVVPPQTRTLQATIGDVTPTAELLTENLATINDKPTSAIANAPEAEKVPVKKRAGGLGGLINTIVAAVDKREDKLIEFTDADNDEGARLTGVNLGIFKIKKQ